ncbi:TIGR03013 family XrtA/PEP-CTERM system glycosyltransferase [Noviherbaspirillum galbum]|uniref:TIGR03013 family PEP-CTERM/XrtA system glycosyltransferase n=1 Tax=Noviherbaspirillum galbum TaxID=2709383 RepID=A0A6B3SU51_9BURK|nr:TIGR03013 family XrtA/PEP-CTERM system glycosyltransferase [Noviherbaspirillum galbum]NEX64121.1 TIGR03013 family PEP-CTERM/XrtA system glycosyltransferase [Noviherbaspirillum galbum]
MIKIFNHFVPRIVSLLFLSELLMLLASPYLAGAVRFAASDYRFVEAIPNFGASAIAFALILTFCMAAFGMYQMQSRESVHASLYRMFPAFGVGVPLVVLAFYLFPELFIGRGILSIAILFGFTCILFSRLLLLRYFKFHFLKKRILFLGDSELANECIDLTNANSFYERYDVVGFVPLLNNELTGHGAAVLPADQSLMDIAAKYSVHEIVISLKNWRGVNIPIQQLLECKVRGVAVTQIARFFEREANQIKISYLQPSWLVFGDGFNQGMVRALGKRLIDLLASLALLTVALPVMLITAVCIVLEDGGPVLYRQERVGKNGKTFMVLKFRSMRTDAEKSGNPQWAQVGDTRVTRVGRFIRKTRIDELPQILNVLRGEMSFVGPRPERPYFVKQLCEQVPFYDMRHSIKPGLTGFAQVRYQYGATVDDAIEKLQYDLYYVKNNSLFLDLLIIIDTVQVVLFAKGSR